MLEQCRSTVYEKTEWNFEAASDAALVLEAQAGNHGAFVELRKRHAKKLLPRIYRITRSWEDAEDVLQESFLRAFVHLPTFEGRSSFSSWLTRIAINSALMMLRKRRVVEISIDNTLTDEESGPRWEPPDTRKNPEEVYAQRQLEQQLLVAIDRLSPQLRKAVEIRQAKDYSTKEVAAALGISVPAAKSRLMRAKGRIRSSMMLRPLSTIRPEQVDRALA
jgi:RNA polymerase sigma-70 factor, ECF subfamily